MYDENRNGAICEIPSLPGYAVSEDGTFWSRKIPGHRGEVGEAWRAIKGRPDKDGYLQVNPSVGGVATNIKIHTVVLTAFCGHPADGQVCRHLDGDNQNNAISNLAWGTMKENSRDKIVHGTNNNGSRHGQSKLTESQVAEIRRRYASGKVHQRSIAQEFGVSRELISQIVRGQIWKHVP